MRWPWSPGARPGLRAQFPELYRLLLGNAQGFVIELFCGLGMSLPQQQLAFEPVQLGCEPALPCPFNGLKSIVQQCCGLFDLSCHLHALARRAM